VNFGTVVIPAPGLYQRAEVYAVCTGTISPIVYVDPIIRGQPGEQSCIEHERWHADARHGLKSVLSWCVMALLVFSIGVTWAFGPAVVVLIEWALFVGWVSAHLHWLRDCEIEADKQALALTSPRDFVAFVFLHPHPKGRWGRFLYGQSPEDRIKRILPVIPKGAFKCPKPSRRSRSPSPAASSPSRPPTAAT